MNAAIAQRPTLSHLIEKRIRITYGDGMLQVSGQSHFRVTMRLVGTRRRMTVDFWSCFEPEACSVFSCVLSEADVTGSFEDFCDDFGYDTDSRKAEAIYSACVVLGKRLRKFLGSQFDTFMGAERDV